MAERHELPVVDVELIVRVGAGADEPRVAGRASLAADLLDEGAGARGATELADAVDVLGATLETGASWDATHVAIHVLAGRLDPALALMADVVRAPAFAEADVARKRDERLAALLQEREEPRTLAIQALQRVIYGERHPYGAPLHGTPESVAALDRAALHGFWSAHVRPEDAFLVAAGDVRPDTLLARLERAFGGWRGGGAPAPPVPPPPPPGGPAVYVVDRPGAPQSEIRVGHAGVPRNTPDYFPLLVTNTVLGGAFTSRLNRVLREEKGYTYGANSRWELRLGAGPFVAGAAVSTAATEDAVREFARQIRRLREEPPAGEELERARRYLALGLPRRLETTGDLAARCAEIGLYGLEDDYLACYVESVEAVTEADVARVAGSHLYPEHLAIVVAGDLQKVEGGLAGLGLGPVRVVETG